MFKRKYKMIIKIEGMKCEHCSNRVSSCLKEIENVKKVKIHLDKKEAILYLNELIDENIVRNKIESIGYEVIEIINKI